MDFKAVIFDMDGLMFNTESIYFKANKKTADRIGLPFTEEFYLQFVGSSDKDLFNGMYNHFNDDEKVDQFVEQSNKDAHDMLTSGSVEKKKGLIQLLDILNKKDIKCVIASSSEKWLVEAVTENNSVRDYFVDAVGGDEVEHSKPNPDIFLKALEKLGTTKEETLILEDSLNGVRAAYSAGIPVIMIPDLIDPNDEAKEKALSIEEDLLKVIDYFK